VELAVQSQLLLPVGRTYAATWLVVRGRKRSIKKKKKKQSIGEYCRRKRNTVGGGRIAEIRINYDCRSLLGLYKILILI